MSGLMNKVKDAFSGEKDTPEARAANIGNNGMFSNTLDTPNGFSISGSTAWKREANGLRRQSMVLPGILITKASVAATTSRAWTLSSLISLANAPETMIPPPRRATEVARE